MSRILSFSSDEEFAQRLESLVVDSGYSNRSRFLRDASLHYSDHRRRGDLEGMARESLVEGTMVLYYQHDVERSLMHIRHRKGLEVHSYHHTCLSHSHTCVDTLLIAGQAGLLNDTVKDLRATEGVDRVEFIVAPSKEHGCC